MIKINEKLYTIIGIIAVVVILGTIFWYRLNMGTSIFSFDLPQDENAPAKSDTTASDSTSLSYTEALKIYGDKRFQFGFDSTNNCMMNPSSVVLKKGTKVMFDNRTDKQITVYLDGTAYNIKTYDFKIITLTTSAQLPHTMQVDCNTGKNNGQIILGQ